jgi:tetratricopeptide (TPR) repeat protein
VASSLHQAFPNNPNFQRYYARLLYSTGNFNEAETVSLDIIQKIDSNRVGYEGTSGRYAAFFLGQIYERRRNEHKAEHFYKRAVEFGYEVNATDKGYFLYSLLNLAQIAEKNGKDESAKNYYKQVKKFARRKQDVHREARQGLRQLRRS